MSVRRSGRESSVLSGVPAAVDYETGDCYLLSQHSTDRACEQDIRTGELRVNNNNQGIIQAILTLRLKGFASNFHTPKYMVLYYVYVGSQNFHTPKHKFL